MKDPYLIPGQVCKVWDNEKQKKLATFYQTSNTINYFECNNEIIDFAFYRPIGTEWDFAPDWAVCSVIFGGGQIYFSNTVEIKYTDIFTWIFKRESKYKRMVSCGWTKDKNRRENSPNSLCMRPAWAEVEA